MNDMTEQEKFSRGFSTDNVKSKSEGTLGAPNFDYNSLLWQAFIDGSQFGVFWKDSERRFIGCNQFFLDYYGFSSVDAILGKTDEDMGWHVRPGKYRDEELRVLRDGEVSINVNGTCIARGRVHDIIASKMPVCDQDGHIIGLMGYFRDNSNKTLTASEKEIITRSSRADELTGLMNSVGFQADYLMYEDEYHFHKTDFANIRMTIANLDELERLHGSRFCEHVIKIVADSIKRVCGQAASISRLSGGEFAILKQCESVGEIETLIADIKRASVGEHALNGITFEIALIDSFSLFSEAGERTRHLTIFNDREMAEEKIQRILGINFECMALIDAHTLMMYYCYFGVNIPASHWSKLYGDVTNGVPYDDVIRTASREWATDDYTDKMYDSAKATTVLAELAAHGSYQARVKVNGSEPGDEPQWKLMRYSWMDTEHEWILYVQIDVTDATRMRLAAAAESKKRIDAALGMAATAREAKTNFIARISHDIRTPLAAVKSMTEFAMRDMDDKARLEHDLKNIMNASAYLNSLMDDVLDVSKINSGMVNLRPEPYHFKKYGEEIRPIVEAEAMKKGLNVTFAEHGDDMAVLMDHNRLRQLSLNIIMNALNYTPRGGDVSIDIDENAKGDGTAQCRLTVTDNGIGMTEKFQHEMFDAFAQDMDNPARKDLGSGTGLGLYIVQKLVTLMGGTIDVESKVGIGTTVTVTLPAKIAAEVEEKQDAAEPEEKFSLTGRVLLVEDNEINREIATRILEEMGLDIDAAEDGKAAAEAFERSPVGYYSIILMDIQMPVMNGYESTKAIRALDRSDARTIPIIAMTADAYEEAKRIAKEVGMTDYVTKPLDIPSVKRVIAEAIKG